MASALSFLALLVIPDLKMSDRGLFSGAAFEFVPVRADEA
jgi:adenine deaminase